MSRSPEVDAWFSACTNPQVAAMQRVRSIVLAADPRMSECVKWKTPTFMYRGNLASFIPGAKQHVSLMFHTGAAIPGDHPRLEGSGDTARTMRFKDLAEVEALRTELEAIVAAWCAFKDGEGGATAKKPAAKKNAKAGAKKHPARPAK